MNPNEIAGMLNHELRLDTVEKGLTRVTDRIEWLEKQVDTDLTDLEDRLSGKMEQVTAIVDTRLRPIEALAKGQEGTRKWLIGIAISIFITLLSSVAWINSTIGKLEARGEFNHQTVEMMANQIERVENKIDKREAKDIKNEMEEHK